MSLGDSFRRTVELSGAMLRVCEATRSLVTTGIIKSENTYEVSMENVRAVRLTLAKLDDLVSQCSEERKNENSN